MNGHVDYGRFLSRAYSDERAEESEASFRKATRVAKPEELTDAYGARSATSTTSATASTTS